MKFDLDKSLSRLSHVSQILLVGFAIFGYFYTVRPIYQKEVLSENIAQKELQLSKLNQEKETVYSQIETYKDKENKLLSNVESLQKQKKETEGELIITEKELDTIRIELQKTKGDLLLAENQIKDKTRYLTKLENAQRKGMSDVYFENFSGIISVSYLREHPIYAFDKVEPDELTISLLRDKISSPYIAIKKALADSDHNFLEANKNVSNKLREEIVNYISKKIENDKNKLNSDYQSLFDSISEVRAECQNKKSKIKDGLDEVVWSYECNVKINKLINDFYSNNMNEAMRYINSLRSDFR